MVRKILLFSVLILSSFVAKAQTKKLCYLYYKNVGVFKSSVDSGQICKTNEILYKADPYGLGCASDLIGITAVQCFDDFMRKTKNKWKYESTVMFEGHFQDVLRGTTALVTVIILSKNE